jgi:hypothetical protein
MAGLPILLADSVVPVWRGRWPHRRFPGPAVPGGGGVALDSVAVTDDILTVGGAYWWPVDASGDMAAGTGTVEVVDNIATYTDGVETASWPVDGTPEDDGPGAFILDGVTDGIASFTPDAATYTMPVNTP